MGRMGHWGRVSIELSKSLLLSIIDKKSRFRYMKKRSHFTQYELRVARIIRDGIRIKLSEEKASAIIKKFSTQNLKPLISNLKKNIHEKLMVRILFDKLHGYQFDPPNSFENFFLEQLVIERPEGKNLFEIKLGDYKKVLRGQIKKNDYPELYHLVIR